MITLLLVYLAFFGGVYGWYIPLARWIDAALLIALAAAFVLSFKRWGAVERIGLGLIAAQGLSAAINQVSIEWIAWRLLTLAGYLGMYALARKPGFLKKPGFSRSAVVAGWLLFPLALVGWALLGFERLALFDNPNVTASFFLLLWPVGVGTLRGRPRWVWGALGVTAILTTGSRGALVGVGITTLHLIQIPWWAAGAAGVGGLGVGWLFPDLLFRHSDSMRIGVFKQAWDLFTSSPLIGRGPYAMLTAEHGIFHALNLPLTVAIDSGLLGLGALGLGAWRAACAKRTRWANAALLGWLAFQMAEDTFWFISVGLLVMILLAGKE